MKRLLYPLVCLSLLLGVAPAAAATYEQRLIAHLRKLGYDDITLSFTLLGRAQIVATGKEDTREIVLNPRTGEILRDFALTIESDGVEAEVVAVEPIVLAPEVETIAGVPLDLPPAEVVAEPVPVVTENPFEALTDTTPPDVVIPDVPDLSTPPDTGTPAEPSDPAGSTDGLDGGVAP